jgi:hypothetical protein
VLGELEIIVPAAVIRANFKNHGKHCLPFQLACCALSRQQRL